MKSHHFILGGSCEKIAKISEKGPFFPYTTELLLPYVQSDLD